MTDDAGAIAFGEKVLALLDQGRFTATYKFAVLLGLVDLCLEGVTSTGAAPQAITTAQLADGACNSAKRDHLAAADHVERWARRAHDHATDLRDLAAAARWDDGPARVLGIARAAYLYLSPTSRLWHAAGAFVPADPARLARALAA